MPLMAGLCESGNVLKDENGDLTEIKGSSNQVRNSLVQTTKDSGRASQDVSLPISCPLVTSFLPQNYLKEVFSRFQLYRNVQDQGVVCSGSDSPSVSLCPPRLSFQWSNQVVREAGSLPEAERTAWGGKSPSKGQTSGGDGDRGTATQKPTRSGVWREKAARGSSPLHRTGHTPWAGRAPFSLALY